MAVPIRVFDMNQWTVDEEKIPKFLYRVQYPRTATQYSECTGFTARDTQTTFGRTQGRDFESSLDYHLNWCKSKDSMYISVFGDLEQAINWAKAWCRNNQGEEAVIYTIRGSELGEVPVFSAKEILDELAQFVTRLCRDKFWDEYLCLHSIPKDAIMRDDNGNPIVTMIPAVQALIDATLEQQDSLQVPTHRDDDSISNTSEYSNSTAVLSTTSNDELLLTLSQLGIKGEDKNTEGSVDALSEYETER